MTPREAIARLRELERAATPGPWVNPDGYCVRQDVTEGQWGPVCLCWPLHLAAAPAHHKKIETQVADMELIAAARNALPALIDVAEALREIMALRTSMTPNLDGQHELFVPANVWRRALVAIETLQAK